MFTGLIEDVGQVSGLEPRPPGVRLRIRTRLAEGLAPGDSIAVNGVCLTATQVEDGEIRADVGPETARVTTLGSLRQDQPVNLERSLRADGRFGGHFVQGHVDGTGVLGAIREEGDARWVTIHYPAHLDPLFVPKGSVAVDGISLTVAALGEAQFDVMIVPVTWEGTNLASLRVGDQVNLECDMIGKYVARAVAVFGRQMRGAADMRPDRHT